MEATLTVSLNPFGGRLLDADADPELDRIVAEAARVTGYPIALVSLLLDRTQVFRAQVGLPTALATAGATDRQASLCQFVVSSGQPFEVTSALDEGMPTELCQRLGIGSYHGLPLHAGGHTVGSLCVIDVKANRLSEAARAALDGLANQASRRLSELQAQRATSAMLGHAIAPAFCEVRNLLLPLFAAPEMLRVIAAELAPIRRLVAGAANNQIAPEELFHVAGLLAESANSQAELAKAAGMIEDAVQKIAACVDAVQNVVNGSTDSVHLSAAVAAATKTSHHVTKSIGGVHWTGIEGGLRVGGLGAPPAVVIALALQALCQRTQRQSTTGIHGVVSADDRYVYLELSANLSEQENEALALELNQLLGTSAFSPRGHGVLLRLLRIGPLTAVAPDATS